VLPERLSVAFTDRYRTAVFSEPELLHECESLCRADYLNVRPAENDLVDRCGVVRFHVIYYEVIERPSCEDVLNVFDELTADRPVTRVHKNSFFIQKKVRVI